ncbi:rhodanese-like domain-containing protein [Shinella granuli]|uniref:rhodanese-like domain-containing protein n=1 Tax=Shinella granuli TaxID=323621 RepID=UPI0033823800
MGIAKKVDQALRNRCINAPPSWDHDDIGVTDQLRTMIRHEQEATVSAQRAVVDCAACEPVPVLAHLGTSQSENLRNDTELESAEPVIEKRDNKGSVLFGMICLYYVIYASCKSQHVLARVKLIPKEPTMSNAVISIPAAPSDIAREHFAAEFSFETDCWDVHDALAREPGFVLLDVRGPAMFAKGHVPGAINLPHGKITRSSWNAGRGHALRHLLRRTSLQTL